MATYTSDIVYDGEETIVLSIDIGTTHTAVTFSHVYPGDTPDVRSVLKWPGQEDAAGDSKACPKIPTIIAYQNGIAMFCGAEAVEYLDDDEYEVARWFKLHLHPESMRISDQPPAYDDNPDSLRAIEIPQLPSGVSLETVYVDFLQYIYEATRNYFIKGTPNGANIWGRLQNDIVFVLCTPNGWDISQHMFLRMAVIKAGLVSENDADGRLELITEGEASVHYALAHTRPAKWLRSGSVFMVTDAGGSTVDSTLYQCRSTYPLVLEEVCASECVQAGGVFVDRAVEDVLKQKLGGSRYATNEWIASIIRAFERKTKRIFDGSQTSSVLTFGGSGDNDRPKGIIKGKLSLTQQEVGSAFEDVITRIADSCLKLLQGRNIEHLLLVGGFGESPFLRARLAELLHGQGTDVVTVEEPSKKAAAEGATIWFIKQLVKARSARYTYGMEATTCYKPHLHHERQYDAFISLNGEKRVDVFDPFIEKNHPLPKDWQMVNKYNRKYETPPSNLADFSTIIYVWEGNNPTTWVKGLDGQLLPGMQRLCVLRADMSGLYQSLTRRANAHGSVYWRLDYEVVVSFNRAKLQAKLRWKENGVTREGPITILPQSTF